VADHIRPLEIMRSNLVGTDAGENNEPAGGFSVRAARSIGCWFEAHANRHHSGRVVSLRAGMTNREKRRYQNASGWGATGSSLAFDISSKAVTCGDDGAALWFLALTNTTPVTIRIIAAATMIALRMESSSWGPVAWSAQRPPAWVALGAAAVQRWLYIFA
jgi:hypothetical protein